MYTSIGTSFEFEILTSSEDLDQKKLRNYFSPHSYPQARVKIQTKVLAIWPKLSVLGM